VDDDVDVAGIVEVDVELDVVVEVVGVVEVVEVVVDEVGSVLVATADVDVEPSTGCVVVVSGVDVVVEVVDVGATGGCVVVVGVAPSGARSADRVSHCDGIAVAATTNSPTNP
jgi:hypothetical protein